MGMNFLGVQFILFMDTLPASPKSDDLNSESVYKLFIIVFAVSHRRTAVVRGTNGGGGAEGGGAKGGNHGT